MDLKVTLSRQPRVPSWWRDDWHGAELVLQHGGAPYLTLRALVRLRPFRVIAVRRRQLADSRLHGPEQEWTWPPRRPEPDRA